MSEIITVVILLAAILFALLVLRVLLTAITFVTAHVIWFIHDRTWDWGGMFAVRGRKCTPLEAWRRYVRLVIGICLVLAAALAVSSVLRYDLTLGLYMGILFLSFIVVWRVHECVWRHIFKRP